MDQAIVDLRARQAQLSPKEGDAPVLDMGDACVVNMVGYMATDAGAKGEVSSLSPPPPSPPHPNTNPPPPPALAQRRLR